MIFGRRNFCFYEVIKEASKGINTININGWAPGSRQGHTPMADKQKKKEEIPPRKVKSSRLSASHHSADWGWFCLESLCWGCCCPKLLTLPVMNASKWVHFPYLLDIPVFLSGFQSPTEDVWIWACLLLAFAIFDFSYQHLALAYTRL